ncbi:hypothetical protein [Streptomyces sp. NPDC057403]|uniref:hypothetical protein n=1 Tax=Streptomyces sp. NPDC057403 TaxID=3346119 RepID=UPI003679F9AA
MSRTFTEGVEQLHADAAALPSLLDDGVEGAATFAAVLSGHVLNLDARLSALNEQAQQLGAEPLADVVTGSVTASDTVRARLLAAARRGPGELAVALGKAARGPAGRLRPEDPPPVESLDDAGRAAIALLTQAHHQVDEVRAEELTGADPVKAAMVLAAVAVKLAGEVMADEDVTEWITGLAAAWSAGGEWHG